MNQTTAMSEREAFEAHAASKGWRLNTTSGGRYLNNATDAFWEVWQARASTPTAQGNTGDKDLIREQFNAIGKVNIPTREGMGLTTQPPEPSKADVVEHHPDAIHPNSSCWNQMFAQANALLALRPSPKADHIGGANELVERVARAIEETYTLDRHAYSFGEADYTLKNPLECAQAALSALHPSDEVIAGMIDEHELFEVVSQAMSEWKNTSPSAVDYKSCNRYITEKILSHSQKHKPVDGWLPISSATKGDYILASYKLSVFIAVWSEERGEGVWLGDDYKVLPNQPTHWQPLPPPPAALKPETTGDVK